MPNLVDAVVKTVHSIYEDGNKFVVNFTYDCYGRLSKKSKRFDTLAEAEAFDEGTEFTIYM